MSKKNKKTIEKTFKPENFKTQDEAEEGAEEYLKSQPIYTVFNFFFGGPNNVNKVKSNVEGKPTQPPY